MEPVRCAGWEQRRRGARGGRAGFTLIEILVVAALTVIVLVAVWQVFDFFYGTTGKTGVTRLTDKSMIQREIRLGLRRLMQRMRESSELLDAPGQTVEVLTFKDILRNEVRLRVDPTQKRLVSERKEGGAFVLETTPETVKSEDGEEVRPAHPVRIEGVQKASFTVVSPTCVIVNLSLVSGKIEDTIMIGLHLRNYGVRHN